MEGCDDDGNAAGCAAEKLETGLAAFGHCPNAPVAVKAEEELGVAGGVCPNNGLAEAKEKVAGGGAGAAAGALLHAAAQDEQEAVLETQRRWNVWAHSDVNEACQRPTWPPQASHRLVVVLVLAAMISSSRPSPIFCVGVY
jgi:hypothetical protein